MSDARFEDGAEAPLRLIAQDADGLGVMSALLQDAVFPITEMRFVKVRRRFALMLNRFRWEDRTAADQAKRGYERVQSVLVFEDVLAVRSTGIVHVERDTVLSLLQLSFQPGADGTGVVTMVLAGDGAIALDIETLDAQLVDVTRPYLAPSGMAPQHEA